MLSDSSASDSPVNRRKVNKRALYSSDEDDDESDSPIKKWKGSRRKTVSSSSSQSSDVVAGPSKRKVCQIISGSERNSSSMSSDSEVDEICRPWTSKEVRGKRTIYSDSDISTVEDEKTDNTHKTLANNQEDGGDSSSTSEDGERCIICFKSLRPPMARPSNCNHNFHSECLIAWSKTSNTCPFDRVKYTEILVANSKGELLDRHAVTTPPPPQYHNDDDEPEINEDETLCEVCLNFDREHEMLLCDRCEAGYHLDCLTPPLDAIPSGTWYCPICTQLAPNMHFENVSNYLSDVSSNYLSDVSF